MVLLLFAQSGAMTEDAMAPCRSIFVPLFITSLRQPTKLEREETPWIARVAVLPKIMLVGRLVLESEIRHNIGEGWRQVV